MEIVVENQDEIKIFSFRGNLLELNPTKAK